MPLTIRPATPSDAPTLTAIYLSAFSQDSISLLVFPRVPATTEFWTQSILTEIQDPHSYFLCVIDSGHPSRTEQIIAYAKWLSPGAPHWDTDEMQTWPEEGDRKLADFFFGNLARKHAALMGKRRHWYLEILATRKEDQGRGAGGMLLKWGLQKADEDEVETFIEASPVGVPVYTKFGFEEVDRLAMDLTTKAVDENEFVEVFMVRKARGKEIG